MATLEQMFLSRVVSSMVIAMEMLKAYAEDGVLRVEDKLGGHRHCARLATQIDGDETPIVSAIRYVTESPAQVFAINVTLMGTRGAAKTKVADRMFCAFYTKAQVLRALNNFGYALKIHTNCVCIASVTLTNMFRSFGLPIVAVETPFALKDVPSDPTRPTAPYAKAWESWISTEAHGHNVANLNNLRYDMRIVFIN